eukprot:CAMPEP_0194552584 /NCGR_PEP_ID=MMETSP0253-20130528/96801_1 /TAXON_ID=2966 /ORGANISM="Noctiluca scintillans" /LENGTH=228 /DNA_ID=CAMNT_0039400057 /DNA_START=306 /DNA_END=992 /DNA_ORIENTATION=+
MNFIAGIFVTDAMELASQDRELRQHNDRMRTKKNMEVLSALFEEMDSSGCGILYRSEFPSLLQGPQVQALFSHFKFDIVDGDSFFTLLDVDGSGTVDIEEFVVGCLRMHGKSNAIGMEISIHEIRQFAKRLVHDVEELQENGVRVREEIRDIFAVLETLEGAVLKGVGRTGGRIEERLGKEACSDNSKDFHLDMSAGVVEVDVPVDRQYQVNQFSAETLSSITSADSN